MELVQTVTSDGVKLDGAMLKSESNCSVPIDAALLLHGVGSNFYQSRFYKQLSPTLLRLGCSVLWSNNRGHDAIFYASKNGKRAVLGSGVEIVGESIFDIHSWCDYLNSQGFQRIALIGHSLGAIKSIYTQSHQPHQSVVAMVAASAPSLSFRRLSQGERAADFLHWIEQSQKCIENGSPERLLEVNFPFPLWISAAAYLDKYGEKENYDILKFVDRIQCPSMLVYGQQELDSGGIAFHNLDHELAELLVGKENFEIQTIAGADHFYSGKMPILAARIEHWFQSLQS